MLRARLCADALDAVPLDLTAAEEEAAAVESVQYSHDEARLDGAFCFGRLRVERLAPAIDSLPAVAELPSRFRDAFFGGLDYTVLARRL